MSHPSLIKEIIDTTSIPVMAKARIGHDEEARVLENLGVDMIDESEVLTPADPFYHIAKMTIQSHSFAAALAWEKQYVE